MNVSAEHPTPHVDEEKKQLWRRMISDHRDVIAGEVAGALRGDRGASRPIAFGRLTRRRCDIAEGVLDPAATKKLYPAVGSRFPKAAPTPQAAVAARAFRFLLSLKTWI
jgi:hypothetical protein